MCYWDRRKGVRNFLIKPVEKEIHGSQLQQGQFYIVSWLVWMYSQILIIPGWIIQVTGIMSHAALLQPLHALFWEGKFCSVHSYTTLLIFVCFSHFMREPRQAARSSQVFLCDSASLAGRAWKNQPHCKRDKCLGKAEPLPWLCVSTRGVTSLVRAKTDFRAHRQPLAGLAQRLEHICSVLAKSKPPRGSVPPLSVLSIFTTFSFSSHAQLS